MTLDQAQFRQLFPALETWAWFDTPGCPPGATPVTEALTELMSKWGDGDFDWKSWDAASERARDLFSKLAGVPVSTVAVLGSVAEAAATIARTLPPGSIVVPSDDFRSVLYPWLQLDQTRNPVIRVQSSSGPVSTDDIVLAIRPDTVLVAASDTLASTGQRLDFGILRRATNVVGARLFADLTQSFGILGHADAMDADFVAVHGYKWLFCPRGAAWLVVHQDRIGELRPLLPSWKSTDPPYGYYGGTLDLPSAASRLDTSPAWFSWVGAIAALEVALDIDHHDVEQHCVSLAQLWYHGAKEMGYRPILSNQQSHIAVVDVGDSAPMLQDRLTLAKVKTSVGGSKLRIGVHYFNTVADVNAALDAIRPL